MNDIYIYKNTTTNSTQTLGKPYIQEPYIHDPYRNPTVTLQEPYSNPTGTLQEHTRTLQEPYKFHLNIRISHHFSNVDP